MFAILYLPTGELVRHMNSPLPVLESDKSLLDLNKVCKNLGTSYYSGPYYTKYYVGCNVVVSPYYLEIIEVNDEGI